MVFSQLFVGDVASSREICHWFLCQVLSRIVLGGHPEAGPLWPSELATFEGGHRRSGFHGTKRDLDECVWKTQPTRLRDWIDHIRQGFIYNLELPPPSNSHHQDYFIFVGNPYKPSFVTVTGWGVDQIYNWPKSLTGGWEWRFPSKISFSNWLIFGGFPSALET